MVAIAATGHLVSLALAAVVLGLGYGAAAPASTHLLVPQTPRPVFNLVMSLRQIGVPLGGVLGALILPPLVLAIGWRLALLTELAPILLLLALIEYAAPALGRRAGARPSGARPNICCSPSRCCATGASAGCRSPVSSIPACSSPSWHS